MAQRVNPVSFRLGINHFWQSEWYSNTNYAALFFEDNMLKRYFKNIFEKRGIFFKRALIKRTPKNLFIFLEIYVNPYFRYAIPREYRFTLKKYHRVLQFERNIKHFLKRYTPGLFTPSGEETWASSEKAHKVSRAILAEKVNRKKLNFEKNGYYSSDEDEWEKKKKYTKPVKNPVKGLHFTIHNLFMINRIHRNYLKRLRGQFFRYKRYKFTLTILNIFNIVLRTKGAVFLTRILAHELQFLERRKKNKIVWRFVSFVGKLVRSISYQNKAIHGMRIQIKGRFRGISRPKKVRFREGAVPFNTLRAYVDFAYAPAITINGTFGIKTWICYKGIL